MAVLIPQSKDWNKFTFITICTFHSGCLFPPLYIPLTPFPPLLADTAQEGWPEAGYGSDNDSRI